MNIERSSTKKRISISDLRPGMYVIGLDRSWLQTPFLFHRKHIRSQDEIAKFHKHGIREVVIDTQRGADVDDRPAMTTDEPARAGIVQTPAPSKSTVAARPLSAAELAFQPLAKELDVARAIHDEALSAAQVIFDGVAGGAPIDSQIAQHVVAKLMDSITRSPEANLLLMQMRRFQSDLFTHAVNVCVLSLVVATLEELADDLSALGMAALLHDVGEMRLPRTLIRKRNGFTEAEQRLIEQHPMLGAALLSQCEDVPALVRHIVIEHHERIDGSGYPVGSRGAEVSRYSQIVAIADTYDDMLSGRNQIAHQPTEVLRQLYLQANAGALDLDLVEKVIRGLGVYPIGSLVELSSGERAIVLVADRSDTIKPIVRIIVSRTGMKQLNGPIVSLAESGSVAADRRIVNVLDPRKEGIDPMAFLKIAPALAG